MRPLIVILTLVLTVPIIVAQTGGSSSAEGESAAGTAAQMAFFTRPLNPEERPSRAPFQDAMLVDLEGAMHRLPLSFDPPTKQFRVRTNAHERVLLLPQIHEIAQWNRLRIVSVTVRTAGGSRECPGVVLVDGQALLYRHYGVDRTEYFSKMRDDEYAEIIGLRRRDLRMVFREHPARVEPLLKQHRTFQREPLLIELFQLYND